MQTYYLIFGVQKIKIGRVGNTDQNVLQSSTYHLYSDDKMFLVSTQILSLPSFSLIWSVEWNSSIQHFFQILIDSEYW